ncbi:DUF1989 domain-containing protein [Arenimonas composti]|uniref:DUF1989 domain-containing protein n=1 Tax=Arenimonas composti TR7-09 = DSM 18010 TaxID=1121013 RepID=A0A091C1V5_9GAMM|nr:urea carboxylase-associated family protein [Arenimonas composti]KFN50620.1 hypothetical protein P873_05525 [Arenimonas composti TR7-09 = DSM 18010]
MSNAAISFTRIPPCSARAAELEAGDLLEIVDPEGEQVCDLVAFRRDDLREYLSSGRSLDYASKLWLGTGDLLYSNRSRPMFEIVADDVGRHDFTLTPCSRDTFRILYGHTDPKPGCEGNLEMALAPWGIDRDRIPIAFNVFMHVAFDGDGRISVLPPKSRAGDRILLRALMPMVVAMTACSAPQSNNGRFKPIDFRVLRGDDAARVAAASAAGT